MKLTRIRKMCYGIMQVAEELNLRVVKIEPRSYMDKDGLGNIDHNDCYILTNAPEMILKSFWHNLWEDGADPGWDFSIFMEYLEKTGYLCQVVDMPKVNVCINH